MGIESGASLKLVRSRLTYGACAPSVKSDNNPV